MYIEPEISYQITKGSPIHKWLVACELVKAPGYVEKQCDFFIEINRGGAFSQTKVTALIDIANLTWHSSIIEWYGRVLTIGHDSYKTLHARGVYDLDSQQGSLTFEPDPAFSELATTRLW